MHIGIRSWPKCVVPLPADTVARASVAASPTLQVEVRPTSGDEQGQVLYEVTHASVLDVNGSVSQ